MACALVLHDLRNSMREDRERLYGTFRWYCWRMCTPQTALFTFINPDSCVRAGGRVHQQPRRLELKMGETVVRQTAWHVGVRSMSMFGQMLRMEMEMDVCCR